MKKFVVVLLALVMALSFSVVSAKDYQVAMICDSSINDGGWGMACYQAMVDAAAQYGWTYKVTDNISQNEYYDSNRQTHYCSRRKSSI